MQDFANDQKNSKEGLRQKYRELRRSVVHDIDAGKKLLSNCLRALSFKENDRVAGYIPMDGEIDVLPLMKYCLDCRLTVSVPVVVKGRRLLKFRKWFHEGGLGVICYEKDMPNVFFVPLIAFDQRLYRLGFGGGYYDCTIEFLRRKQECCKFVGVAYNSQLCDSVPVDHHDQKLDMIVTETDIYF